MDAPIELTIYFDYLSPWCFNTLIRLQQIKQKWGDGVQMVWNSYMLFPEKKQQSVEMLHAYSHNWLHIANEPYSGEFRVWPLNRKPPDCSLPALVAAKVAQSFGDLVFSHYQETLMRSYYWDHRDITNIEVLVQLADNCQIDTTLFEKLYHEPKWSEQIKEEHYQALALGIQTIPMVVVNNERGLAGALSVEEYETVIQMYC
ncbi:MAG: DsbA family protein [SAR324 cluster bacterium]|nr:DsbA family protein [SAR324 cluster bacterium]